MPSFWQPAIVFPLAILFRLGLLAWGKYQDTHSPMKYTDIDYLVFTDAARYVSLHGSPYERDTYRYTPLLSWLLQPTTWPGGLWFESGKALFAAGDVLTGFLTYKILRRYYGMEAARALKFASIWLLNPMVANISTRGSSEGLLAVIVVALLWAALGGHVRLAGLLLGLGVHFKIYPFIYGATVYWWMDAGELNRGKTVSQRVQALLSWRRLELLAFSVLSFMSLNIVMYRIYGPEFIEHSYTYHFTRIDHRHNFSVYNTVLHLQSAVWSSTETTQKPLMQSLAFVPQLVLSVVAIPLLLAKRDLAGTMLCQTMAFVAFNKVCTSQYFLWYMVFLPFYLPGSSMLRSSRLGGLALFAWVVGQAIWLQQGFQLEFLGKSTFLPGLWLATVLFFAVNCWILGLAVSDIGSRSTKGWPHKRP